MALHPLIGHNVLRSHIAQAVDKDRLPQVMLLNGPQGVGKQRLALWIAQRLVCEKGPGEPCGVCSPCRKVLGLGHPDIHWFMPLARPKATESDKQVEELEGMLGEVLEQRRKEPIYGPPDGLTGHFVSTARLIARMAILRPVEGRVKVFIIGCAERLVPQESSPEAANALLKLLEEPSPGTFFILTTADAEGVIPTIRSRSTQLRVGRLPDQDVALFLGNYAQIPESQIGRRVAKGSGSIGNAVADDVDLAKGGQLAASLLESVRTRSQTGWEIAIKQMPFSARGEFTDTLDAMADMLSQAVRGSRGDRELARLAEVPKLKLVAALDRVGEVRELAQNNVNPQILLAVLNQELRDIL
ncbi:MAG: hypothetical protein ABI679_06970 [Gemmatimonadota bacterium]